MVQLQTFWVGINLTLILQNPSENSAQETAVESASYNTVLITLSL